MKSRKGEIKKALEVYSLRFEKNIMPKFLRNKKKLNGLKNIEKNLKIILTPNIVEEGWNCTKIDNKYTSIYGCRCFPSKIRTKWLNRLIEKNNDIDFAQYISRVDNDVAATKAERFLKKLEAEVITIERQKDYTQVPETLRKKIRDIKTRIAKLSSGDEGAFNMGLYLSHSDTSEEKLNEKMGLLEAKMKGLMIIPAALSFKNIIAYKNLWPAVIDFMDMTQNFFSTACAESILLPGRVSSSDITEKG